MKRKKTGRRRGAAYYSLAALCAVVLLFSCAYIVSWYSEKTRIEDAGEEYREMYGAATPGPAATPAPTLRVTEAPPVTAAPVPTLPPPAATEAPEAPAAPAAGDSLLPTPAATPVYYSASTPAPDVQESFSELLALNPDTVGYLEIPGLLSLPVVWRQDDNQHYMNHSFDGQESAEGSLFLDGYNRLGVDGNYIVYGHNMKNDTMFGMLSEYGGLNGVHKYPIAHFDTIYEDGDYVLIGAFHADMDPESEDYFDVRRFLLDEAGYARYTSEILSRSKFYIPVGAQFGDQLLVLVTCSGTSADERMVVVFRGIREGEDPEKLKSLIRTEAFRYQGRE